MPDSSGKANMVINIPDTSDLVVISSGDEGHQGEKDDPEEDQGIGEVGVEQQWKQEADELMVEPAEEHEPQVQQKVDDAESEASTSSFDSGKEPDNESDWNYDPSWDR